MTGESGFGGIVRSTGVLAVREEEEVRRQLQTFLAASLDAKHRESENGCQFFKRVTRGIETKLVVPDPSGAFNTPREQPSRRHSYACTRGQDLDVSTRESSNPSRRPHSRPK